MRKRVIQFVAGFMLGIACLGVNAVGAQASSAYVVTKKVSGEFYSPTTTYYKYTKKKLLKNAVDYSSGVKSWRTRWYYNKKNQLKKKDGFPLNGGGHGDVTICSRNKKGRAVRVEVAANKFWQYKYNKKGYPVSYTERDCGYDQPVTGRGTIKCTKKGLVKSISSGSDTIRYSYDKHGNVKSMTRWGTTTTYHNYYKKSRLVKRVVNNGSNTYSITYKYKKVKVKKALAKKIKKQQKTIINDYSGLPGADFVLY